MKYSLIWWCTDETKIHLSHIWVRFKQNVWVRFKQDLSWVKMMKIELKVLDINIKISHMTIYMILRRQNWRDNIHWTFAHNYLEDEKTFK